MTLSWIRIRKSALVAFAGAFGTLAAFASAAHAACPTNGNSQVFLGWGDTAFYHPVDGGNFENGAPGWTLSGNAGIVSDHSKWNIGTINAHSLELATGSSATTPPICVSSGSPTARMFAYTPKRVSSSGSTLQVEVIYNDATRGAQTVKKLGTTPDELFWDAARKMSLAQGQLSIMPGSDGNTYVQYRFTPLYGTTWRIDDVYVDPRLRY